MRGLKFDASDIL